MRIIDVREITSTSGAFAARRIDGSVVTWGQAGSGGDSSGVAASLTSARNVQQVYATSGAFAAILGDGSLVTCVATSQVCVVIGKFACRRS